MDSPADIKWTGYSLAERDWRWQHVRNNAAQAGFDCVFVPLCVDGRNLHLSLEQARGTRSDCRFLTCLDNAAVILPTDGGEPIVISSSDQKLEKARALGAAGTINYRRVPAWEEEVLSLTSGRGVDHVIEVVGGENLNRSLRPVRVSGTISFIGALAGRRAHINPLGNAAKNVGIHGIDTGSRQMFEEMNRFLASGQLRPVVDKT